MRRQVHLLKLCIIIAASEGSIQGGTIILTKQILERVIELLERTELVMANTFSGYGSASNAATTSAVLGMIKARGEVTQQDLIQFLLGEIGSTVELDNILSVLQKGGLIRAAIRGNSFSYILA